MRFLVTKPENLTRDGLYAKERALIVDLREELRQGRRCQIYATFTGERDVTLRLETVLRQEGFRVSVLRSSVPTDKREEWYERQLKAGVEVVICHPKLVETGLDLLAYQLLHHNLLTAMTTARDERRFPGASSYSFVSCCVRSRLLSGCHAALNSRKAHVEVETQELGVVTSVRKSGSGRSVLHSW